MENNSRLLEIDERLKQIQAEKQSAGKLNSVSKDDRLSQIDERLAQINKLKSQEKSINGYSNYSPFLEARGVAKTIGSIADVGRETFPTTESIQKNTLEQAIRSLEGIQGREEEIQNFKQKLIDIDVNQVKSKKDEFVKNIDEFSGNSGDPEGTIGQFRQKLGEFLPSVSVAGAKIAPAMAAVSQGLKELGLDESYADLISAIGVPNFKALTQLPGNILKKLGDYVATVGNKEYRRSGNVEKAAKFLQEKVGEKNIPEVIGKLEASASPFKGNIKIGESGLNGGESSYRHLTADVADNVGLSQYHRAKAENIPEIGQRRLNNEEVLQREIDKFASKTASPQVSQEFAATERNNYKGQIEFDNIEAKKRADIASSEFNNTSRPEDAGRQTQDYLHNRTTLLKEEALAQTKPLYKAAENKTLNDSPKNVLSAIEQEMKDSLRSSDTHRDMIKAKKAIEEAGGDGARAKEEFIANIKRNLKNDPKMMEIALKEANNVPHGTFKAGDLDKSRKLINGMIEKIPPNEKERRNALRRIVRSLDKDLESIPEIGAAQSLYRELMAPANYIEEHPILGNFLKRQKGYIRQFTVTPAEIPQRVISGSKSVEAAEALMTECAGLGTSEHSQVINSLRSYINSEILGAFVENSGKVNPAKFEQWKKNNPGAFILDPQLNSKLKNLENSQNHVNRIIEKNEDLLSNFYKESMGSILGSKFEGVNPDKIAGRILGSTNSEVVMEEAVELLSKDKTGNSLEGLKRSIIDDLNSKFKSDKFTFATLNNYLTKNKKSLSKIFTPEQIQVMENSKDLLKKQAIMERAGKGTNSDSIPKLMENLGEKTGTKASNALFKLGKSSWTASALGYIGELGNIGKLEYLEKALLNPKMAKFLLKKDIKTKKNFFESFNNKEDFGKWLRDSEGILKTMGNSIKDVGNNFSITSEAIGKAYVNDFMDK